MLKIIYGAIIIKFVVQDSKKYFEMFLCYHAKQKRGMNIMAISPINSVSFKNNYNLSFEGNKKKNHAGNHPVSSPYVKAVPLAVLLAMAPLDNTYTQNLIQENKTTVKVYNRSDGTTTKIFTYEEKDPNVIQTLDSLKLIFTSYDGDNKPEVVKYVTEKTDYTSKKDENGNKIKLIRKEKETVTCTALEKRIAKDTDMLGKPFTVVGHYLHGNSMRMLSTYDRENPNIKLGKTQIIRNDNCVIPISENMYNKIADTMNDKIQYINK